MNTFDSHRSSMNYDNDFLESNPFADTPSRSTELNKSTTTPQVEESFTFESPFEPETMNRHEGEQVDSPITTTGDHLEALTLNTPLENTVEETAEEEPAEEPVEETAEEPVEPETDTQVIYFFFFPDKL